MALPPGLLLNPQTGELTGVPTVPGVYSIALKVRDAIGTTREIVDEVVINAYTPMTWQGDLGHMMANRVATDIDISINGGLAPYSYSVYSGALPDGLVLDTATGIIAGTPSTPGGYALVLRVIDSVGGQADTILAGTVADELTMIYGGDGRGEVGLVENELLGVNGGTTPYTYSVVDALPAGLTFADARVQGTPTAVSSITSTLRVVDAYGFVTDTPITWDIVTGPTLTGLSSHGTVGTAFSGAIVGGGGHTPYTYNWSGAVSVNGLSINASTGAITGTPVSATPINLTGTMFDDLAVSAPNVSIIIDIHAAVVLSGAYVTRAPINSAYSFTPSTSGGWGPYAYSVSAGALPTGLSINSSTGVVSGTCTASGSFTATLRVVDHDGNAATMAFNVVVAGTLAMTGGVTNFATAGVAYSGSTLGGTGGSTPYSFSISSGALPPGLSFNSATGAITGTPAGSFGVGTTYNFTVKLTDANTSNVSNSFSITVADMPTLSGTAPDGSTSNSYSFAYAAAGGHLPLTYSVASGALPTGVTLNTSTGVISGTPSSINTYNFAIRATDNHGNVVTHATDTVVIYGAPTLSGTLTAHAEMGDAYSSGLTSGGGGKQPYNWTVAGTLPPGLTLNAGTGVISGTPSGTRTAAKAYAFTVSVTDMLGHTSSSNQTITLANAVNFSAGYATGGTAGIAYDNVAPTVQDGWTAYSFALASGTLPGGTSLNASTGVISGTLSTAQTVTFSIRVTDSLGVTDTLSRTVTVAAAVGLSGTPADGTVGVAYGFTPSRTGGWGPFAYSISAGALPPGCSINSSTGAITGAPTAAGTYNFTIRCLDTSTYGGSSDTLATTTTIVAKPVLSVTAPRGEAGYAYSGSSSTSGGHAPLSYSRVAGTLPAGVSLNASTGALSGTATTAGTYSFTLRVTDALGNIDDQAVTVTIAGQITNTTNFPDGRVGVAYSGAATSSGGWTPKTYSVASGTLPTGLSLSAAGVLSGTPSAAGTFAFVLRVTDGDSHTATSSQSIVIAAATAALAISASPNPASSSTQSSGAPVVGSVTSTATAAGGTAPYSYAWSFISATGSAGAFSITHPAANSIKGAVTADGTPEYDRTETWRCTVTDSLGATAFVNVSLEIDIFGTQ